MLASLPATANCIGAATLPVGPGGMPLQRTYVTPFQDANKSGLPGMQDTDPITGDSNLCWAATAANMLAYGGWGIGVGDNNAQALFDQQLNPLTPNIGGPTFGGLSLYFDAYHPTANLPDYYGWRYFSPATVDALLADGEAVGLRLFFVGGGPGHVFSVWGIEKDPVTGAYTALIGGDNEDDYTGLVRYPITFDAATGLWQMPDYWRTPYLIQVDTLTSINPSVTLNQVWTSNIPPMSDALSDYLQAYYAYYAEETGITDAAVTGFNGTPLTAADTGRDALRYTPGPGVADQTVGNGIDELVPFSFFMPQIAGRSISSAELTISLTPKALGATTDLLLFADNASIPSTLFGNDILKALALDVPAIVRFPLNAMPSAGGLVDLRALLADGTLDVIFGDDAIIHWVALTVTMFTEVPEPGTLPIMAIALLGLAAARRSPAFGRG